MVVVAEHQLISTTHESGRKPCYSAPGNRGLAALNQGSRGNPHRPTLTGPGDHRSNC
jgi:hypothetical protein